MIGVYFATPGECYTRLPRPKAALRQHLYLYLAVAMLAQAHQLSAAILPPDLWQD